LTWKKKTQTISLFGRTKFLVPFINSGAKLLACKTKHLLHISFNCLGACIFLFLEISHMVAVFKRWTQMSV